jgi:hypothetical protein
MKKLVFSGKTGLFPFKDKFSKFSLVVRRLRPTTNDQRPTFNNLGCSYAALGRPRPRREKIAAKIPVFPAKNAFDHLLNPENPRKRSVKPEGRIRRSPKTPRKQL